MDTKPRAFSYLRFSTPEQMKGDSFRRQFSAAVDYAKKNNLVLDDKLTWHDLGVSAYRGKNADAGRLGEFREAVRAGLVPRGSYLLVESLDRISRQKARTALRTLEDIVDEDITVVTLSDNREYTRDGLNDNPMDLIISILTFIRANEESATKSRRVAASWAARRERAITTKTPFTGSTPAWLRLNEGKFEVIPERAKVILRIYQMAAEGKPANTIAKTLNRNQVPTFQIGRKKARQWHRAYIWRVLTSPTVIGDLTPHSNEYKDGKRIAHAQTTIKGYYPPVVPEDIYQKVSAIMSGPQVSRAGQVKDLINIFAGLTLCHECGSGMHSVGKDKVSVWKSRGTNRPERVRRYLVCSKAKVGAGCHYRGCRYDIIEQAFFRDSLTLLSEAPSGNQSLDDRIAILEANLEGTKDTLESISSAYEQTKSQALLSRLQELEAEARQLQGQLEGLHRQQEDTSGPLVVKRMAELKRLMKEPKLDKKAINLSLKQLVTGVVINSQQRTMTLTWRHGGESEVIWGMPREETT